MSEHFISREEAEGDLLSAAAFIAERIKSSDGHAEAMLAVIPLYLQNGEVDMAAEFANAIDDPFTRNKLLTLVAEKCAELDDDDYAMQLAEAVEDYGLRSKALERIGIQKAEKGEVDKALELAETMDPPDGVLAAVAIRKAADGDETGAREALDGIGFPVDLVHALLEIAASQLGSGAADNALESLNRAAQAAVEIEHNEERIRALLETGNLFIEAKRNDRAIETFDQAKSFAEGLDNVHRDAFLASTATGFLHAGSIDLADRTLDLVADKTQIASCLLGFSREYWKKEERGEAMEAIEEAYAILKSQREIETRSSPARFALFATIAAQFAGFEKGERAIEIGQAIEDENQRIAALTQVAGILTTRKEDEQARHALRSIPDDASRAVALIVMSDEKEKNGDRETAKAFLDEAVHLVESVPQLSSRSNVYNEIAGRYVAYGEGEKATDLASVNLETISTIRDEGIKASALASLSAVTRDITLSEPQKRLLSALLRAK
jgi:tetratricopeptide (TPR) repeat protein